MYYTKLLIEALKCSENEAGEVLNLLQDYGHEASALDRDTFLMLSKNFLHIVKRMQEMSEADKLNLITN